MQGITWPGHEGEPRVFVGVPGVYGPGVVVPLKETGLTLTEARRRIADTPLEIVDLEPRKPAKSAEMEG